MCSRMTPVPPNPNIELVIFDCDGVLIDSEVISARMLQQSVRPYGIEIPMDYIMANYVGRSYPKVLADIQTRFSIQMPDDFEGEYRARLLAAFERELQVMPGVEKVILSLGKPAVIATSSTPKRAQSSLQKVGLLRHFENRLFTASQVPNGKPAPDLFLFAAQEMGVEPQNCLVIEDSETGVQAGLAANMQVVRFVGGQHLSASTDSAGAHEVLQDFAEFFDRYSSLRKPNIA